MSSDWQVEWRTGETLASGTAPAAGLVGVESTAHWGLRAALCAFPEKQDELLASATAEGVGLDVVVDEGSRTLRVSPVSQPAPPAPGPVVVRLSDIRKSRDAIFTDSDLGPDPPVYMDYNASTPIAPEVAAAMASAGLGLPCNPSSSHAFGRRAREHVSGARAALASLTGAPSADCVTFCSCGTEASNWAIQGAVKAWRSAAPAGSGAPHIVTLTIEHPATLRQCEALQAEAEATGGAAGATFTAVGVDARCVADAEAVAAAVTGSTCLVTVMLANNEVGSVQPVADIVRLLDERAAREGGPGARRRVAVHVDASQALGKLPVDVAALGCDYLTVAGHKMYAPPGCGALVVSPAAVWGVPPPMILGAPQEGGNRAGTVSVAMAKALGVASSLSQDFLAGGGSGRLWAMRQRLVDGLAREFAAAGTEAPVINGPAEPGEVLPNTVSVSIRGVSSAELLERLDGVLAASLGSACASIGCSKRKASGVAAAMAQTADLAMGTLRLSTGKHTTPAEVDFVAAALAREAAAMRRGGAPAAEATAGPRNPLRTERLYFGSTALLASLGRVLDSSPALVSDAGGLVATLGGERAELKPVDGCVGVVVLDATAAHPQGGGQPADRGHLVFASGPGGGLVRLPILHVSKGPASSDALRDAILHFVGAADLEGGRAGGEGGGSDADAVKAEAAAATVPAAGSSCAVLVDGAWRAQSARLHSAGHLLDAAIRPLAPALVPTVGYHFPDRPNVSYDGKLSKDECAALVPALQARCDELVGEGGATTVSVFEAGDDEAAARAGLGPEATKGYEKGSTVRVVAVGEPSNVCPCGGTHVQSSAELRGLTITGIKCKKNTTRVSYSLPL